MGYFIERKANRLATSLFLIVAMKAEILTDHLYLLSTWLCLHMLPHDCVSTCYHMIVSSHVITWLCLHMLSHDCVSTCYHMIVSPHVITWLCLHMLSHDSVSTCYHMIVSPHVITWLCLHMLSHDCVSTCYHMIVSPHVISKYKWLAVNNWNFQSSNFVREC